MALPAESFSSVHARTDAPAPRRDTPHLQDFPRRTLLRHTLGVAALGPVTAVSAAGCTASSSGEPDPLEPLVDSARSDAALAHAVARAEPGTADAARRIAAVRTEHAHVLQREIDRLRPPEEQQTGSKPAAPTGGEPAGGQPSAGQGAARLRQALRDAQRQAADLVVWAPAYRAGLSGSVSASCASLLEVLA